jgi:TIR domain
MTAKPQIFLCYPRRRVKAVKSLYDRLVGAGFRPWMDVRDLMAGEIWEDAIRRAIQNSDFFLACLTEDSVRRRGAIQKEIKKALEIWQGELDDDIYLIPVRLDKCELPESLSRFQCVDLFQEDGWTVLLQAIQEGIRRRASMQQPRKALAIEREQFEEPLKTFEAKLRLTAPNDEDQVPWRPYVKGTVTDPSASVWVIVHPQDVPGYWVQPAITIREFGAWAVRIYIGRSGNLDVNKHFEIMAVANPKEILKEGLVLSQWPDAELKSQVIELTRV